MADELLFLQGFYGLGGQRQAAAFDLTDIRRGLAPDPAIYAGDIVVVDGSSIKAAEKQIFQSFPLLSIFRPLRGKRCRQLSDE